MTRFPFDHNGYPYAQGAQEPNEQAEPQSAPFNNAGYTNPQNLDAWGRPQLQYEPAPSPYAPTTNAMQPPQYYGAPAPQYYAAPMSPPEPTYFAAPMPQYYAAPPQPQYYAAPQEFWNSAPPPQQALTLYGDSAQPQGNAGDLAASMQALTVNPGRRHAASLIAEIQNLRLAPGTQSLQSDLDIVTTNQPQRLATDIIPQTDLLKAMCRPPEALKPYMVGASTGIVSIGGGLNMSRLDDLRHAVRSDNVQDIHQPFVLELTARTERGFAVGAKLGSHGVTASAWGGRTSFGQVGFKRLISSSVADREAVCRASQTMRKPENDGVAGFQFVIPTLNTMQDLNTLKPGEERQEMLAKQYWVGAGLSFLSGAQSLGISSLVGGKFVETWSKIDDDTIIYKASPITYSVQKYTSGNLGEQLGLQKEHSEGHEYTLRFDLRQPAGFLACQELLENHILPELHEVKHINCYDAVALVGHDHSDSRKTIRNATLLRGMLGIEVTDSVSLQQLQTASGTEETKTTSHEKKKWNRGGATTSEWRIATAHHTDPMSAKEFRSMVLDRRIGLYTTSTDDEGDRRKVQKKRAEGMQSISAMLDDNPLPTFKVPAVSADVGVEIAYVLTAEDIDTLSHVTAARLLDAAKRSGFDEHATQKAAEVFGAMRDIESDSDAEKEPYAQSLTYHAAPSPDVRVALYAIDRKATAAQSAVLEDYLNKEPDALSLVTRLLRGKLAVPYIVLDCPPIDAAKQVVAGRQADIIRHRLQNSEDLEQLTKTYAMLSTAMQTLEKALALAECGPTGDFDDPNIAAHQQMFWQQALSNLQIGPDQIREWRNEWRALNAIGSFATLHARDDHGDLIEANDSRMDYDQVNYILGNWQSLSGLTEAIKTQPLFDSAPLLHRLGLAATAFEKQGSAFAGDNVKKLMKVTQNVLERIKELEKQLQPEKAEYEPPIAYILRAQRQELVDALRIVMDEDALIAPHKKLRELKAAVTKAGIYQDNPALQPRDCDWDVVAPVQRRHGQSTSSSPNRITQFLGL